MASLADATMKVNVTVHKDSEWLGFADVLVPINSDQFFALAVYANKRNMSVAVLMRQILESWATEPEEAVCR